MKCLPVILTAFLLSLMGCIEDYDVAEVAPEEHLNTEHEHDHEESESCSECDEGTEEHGEDEIDHQTSAAPSGHDHGAGVRNHGTQWFFNQPWAARFIWGKLVRDGLIFLVLAGVIFLVTGRRRR